MGREKTTFLGSITKTHGIAGEILVRSPGYSFTVNNAAEVVFFEIDGIPVPFFIESHHQPDNRSIVLKIRDIDDIVAASRFINRKVYIQTADIDQPVKVNSYSSYKSYTILDAENRELGIISEYLSINENPLFVVADGLNKFYIPASQEFIIRIDRDARKVIVSLPDGLLESQK